MSTDTMLPDNRSGDKSPQEPTYNPYEIFVPTDSDRVLLDAITEVMYGYGEFLDVLRDYVSDHWGDEDHGEMYANLYVLERALDVANARRVEAAASDALEAASQEGSDDE